MRIGWMREEEMATESLHLLIAAPDFSHPHTHFTAAKSQTVLSKARGPPAWSALRENALEIGLKLNDFMA